MWGAIWVGVILVAGLVYYFALPGQDGVTWTERKGAERAIAEQLRDPDSAKYKYRGAGGLFVCGEVNAKNSFGAYSGFQTFIVELGASPGALPHVHMDDTFDFEKEVGRGKDRQRKLDLARCEGGYLDYEDERGQLHMLESNGDETCPTEKDTLHRC